MKTLHAALVLLVGCGGPFSTAPSLAGDGGREAVQAADAGPQSDDAEQAGTLPMTALQTLRTARSSST